MSFYLLLLLFLPSIDSLIHKNLILIMSEFACGANTCGGQKRASNPLQLEWQTFLNDLMLVLATWVLWKSRRALNLWGVPLQPISRHEENKSWTKSPNHPSCAMSWSFVSNGCYVLFLGGLGDDGMGLHPFHLSTPPALAPGTGADMLRVSLPY